jgi:hypothetical protein
MVDKLDDPSIDTDFVMLSARGMLTEIKQNFLLDPNDEGGPLVEGCDVNQKDAAGATAIHHAARSGMLDALKFLVAHDGDVNTSSYGGMRALHHAANMMQESAILFLLVRLYLPGKGR